VAPYEPTRSDPWDLRKVAHLHHLADLTAGDPKHALDFRQVYATVLAGWLACPSQVVLGEKFRPLSIMAG
jgi:hypothetical protein